MKNLLLSLLPFLLLSSTTFSQSVYVGAEIGGVGITAQSSVVADNAITITGEGIYYGLTVEFLTEAYDGPGLYAAASLGFSEVFYNNGGVCSQPDVELNCFNLKNRVVNGRLGVGFESNKAMFAGYFTASGNRPVSDEMIPFAFTFGFGGTIHYEVYKQLNVFARAELGIKTIGQAPIIGADIVNDPFNGIATIGLAWNLNKQ